MQRPIQATKRRCARITSPASFVSLQTNVNMLMVRTSILKMIQSGELIFFFLRPTRIERKTKAPSGVSITRRGEKEVDRESQSFAGLQDQIVY